MATHEQSAHEEEVNDQATEKKNKMHKCYKYMSKIKKLITKSEYSQFLAFLRMSRDNYMSEKMSFYAMIVFQIFFPNQIKDLINNYELRKSLFAQSKFFFSKADRNIYSAACCNLIQRVYMEINSYLETHNLEPQRDSCDQHEKTKSSECTEWQPLHDQPENLNKVEDIKMLLEDEKKVMEGSEEEKRPSSEKSSLICMICFEDYEEGKQFAKAKCGHVGCWDCWNQWLFNCLECPMCKQRTRLKQLIRLP
jgi:hypothetical protein